jgi:uncharacterized membrane protein
MNVLHPPFVHFVVALPVVAFFSQITYLATRDIAYSKAAFRIIAMTLLASFFALYTGMSDAQTVMDGHHILAKGLEVLAAHKTLGILTVALLFVTTLTKWLAISRTSHGIEILATFLIIVTIATSLYQGRQGGLIVYQYGGGIDTKITDKRNIEAAARP